MKRRDFIQKSACCMPAVMATSPILAFEAQEEEDKPKRRKYKISLEIYEAREDTWCHKKGEKFEYPGDMHKICPWLLGSMHDFIRLLSTGSPCPGNMRRLPMRR